VYGVIAMRGMPTRRGQSESGAPKSVKSFENIEKTNVKKVRDNIDRSYVISVFPSHAPGSFTTFPTTCAPFTIFSTAATLAFGTT
jgi:hypothetical protein